MVFLCMEPNPCGSYITFQSASSQVSEHDIWANDPWTTVDCDLVPGAGKGGRAELIPQAASVQMVTWEL